jgi:hypothetical protein
MRTFTWSGARGVARCIVIRGLAAGAERRASNFLGSLPPRPDGIDVVSIILTLPTWSIDAQEQHLSLMAHLSLV